MRKCTIHLLILLFLICGCSKDSARLSVSQEVLRLHALSEQSEATDSIFNYLTSAGELLDENNVMDSLKAKNEYLLGQYFTKIQEPKIAASHFYAATELITQPIKSEIESIYFQKAWSAYAGLGKYGECITILQKYKSLLDESTQARPISYAFYYEEEIYKSKGEYEKALEVNKKRVSFAQKNDTASVISALVSRADLYFHHLRDKKNTFNFLDSLVLEMKHSTPYSNQQVYNTYGVLSYYDGNYLKAKEFYLKSIKQIKLAKNNAYQIGNLNTEYNNLTEVNLDLKKYQEARAYIDTLQKVGIESLDRSQQKSLLRNTLRLASETQQPLDKVFGSLDSINVYQDRRYDEKLNKELLGLTMANENEKRITAEKQRIELENIKNENRVLFISLFTALLVAIGFFIFRQRKFKFERQSLQMQQRLLRSQMNPHFTFNTLYAIQSKIKESPVEASNYLLKFSRLLRLILENSMNNYVSLENELDSLKKYIELQLLRFPDKFTYEIRLNNLEDIDLVFIPPMLMQPFVENSIEHGFKGIDYPGHIEIVLTEHGSFVQCEVLDNGTGIQEHHNSIKKSASVQLISNFIKKATKTQLTIESRDLKETTSGTKVSFLIPYKLTEHD